MAYRTQDYGPFGLGTSAHIPIYLPQDYLSEQTVDDFMCSSTFTNNVLEDLHGWKVIPIISGKINKTKRSGEATFVVVGAFP